ADRAEQVEHLLALLEPLGGVAEISDDPLDRLLHTVEIGERGIDADRALHENATHARVAAGVDDLRLADGGEHPFGSAGVSHRLAGATLQVILKSHLSLFLAVVQLREETEQIILRNHPPPRPWRPRKFPIFAGLDRNFTISVLINH